MYENESYEQYIRSILGYPNTNNMYNYQDNYTMPYRNMQSMQNMQNEELEDCYPDIYKKIYPIVRNRCAQVNEPINRELIDRLTDEIYSNVEVNNNEINVNINLQNDVSNSPTQQGKNRGGTTRETRSPEPVREDRQFGNRNNTLRDLIRILILREFLRRPGNRPRKTK